METAEIVAAIAESNVLIAAQTETIFLFSGLLLALIVAVTWKG